MSVSNKWFLGSNLKPGKEQDDFEGSLKSASHLFKRMLFIIQQKEDAQQATSFSEDDFTQPNWAEKQAFRNGKNSVYKEVKDLLSFVR